MTRDEIIGMARDAGGRRNRVLNAMVFDRDKMLERFAELVAAAERERCAKICEETTITWTEQAYNTWTEQAYNNGCTDCAAEIRSKK